MNFFYLSKMGFPKFGTGFKIFFLNIEISFLEKNTSNLKFLKSL